MGVVRSDLRWGGKLADWSRVAVHQAGKAVVGVNCVVGGARRRGSDIGLQALEAVHPLHVPLDSGLACDWLSTV